MKIEEQLKDLMLLEYNSLTHFSEVCNVPHTTIRSILQRGIGTATLSNMLKICDTLHISADALAKGKIVTTLDTTDTSNMIPEIIELVDTVKHYLQTGRDLTFDGDPITQETIQAISTALEVGVAIAKRNRITKP